MFEFFFNILTLTLCFFSSGTMDKEELARIKPFLGVPFTTKDCFAVKGLLHYLFSYLYTGNVTKLNVFLLLKFYFFNK